MKIIVFILIWTILSLPIAIFIGSLIRLGSGKKMKQKLTIAKLSNNYKHPSGIDMGGFWGLYEGSRLVITDSSFEFIQQLKSEIENVSGRNEQQDSAGVTTYASLKNAC